MITPTAIATPPTSFTLRAVNSSNTPNPSTGSGMIGLMLGLGALADASPSSCITRRRARRLDARACRQVLVLDLVDARAKFRGRAGQLDAPSPHDVRPVGVLQRLAHVLL